ncbi:hypothetical protein MMC25_002389 [Agyrium rufum]|nr:hypothetical protein [Agyrium rufum]
MATLTVIVPLEGERLAKQLREGQAVFSTKFGKYARREAKPGGAPIIMRSDPIGDMHALAHKLRTDFPEACKSITSPVENIYDYFDHYDVHLHGTGVIHSVLGAVREFNLSAARLVDSFASQWKVRWPSRFAHIAPDTTGLFTEQEIQNYGEEFMQDVVKHLKKQRLAFQGEIALQNGQPEDINQRQVTQQARQYPQKQHRRFSTGQSRTGQNDDYVSVVAMQRGPSAPAYPLDSPAVQPHEILRSEAGEMLPEFVVNRQGQCPSDTAREGIPGPYASDSSKGFRHNSNGIMQLAGNVPRAPPPIFIDSIGPQQIRHNWQGPRSAAMTNSTENHSSEQIEDRRPRGNFSNPVSKVWRPLPLTDERIPEKTTFIYPPESFDRSFVRRPSSGNPPPLQPQIFAEPPLVYNGALTAHLSGNSSAPITPHPPIDIKMSSQAASFGGADPRFEHSWAGQNDRVGFPLGDRGQLRPSPAMLSSGVPTSIQQPISMKQKPKGLNNHNQGNMSFVNDARVLEEHPQHAWHGFHKTALSETAFLPEFTEDSSKQFPRGGRRQSQSRSSALESYPQQMSRSTDRQQILPVWSSPIERGQGHLSQGYGGNDHRPPGNPHPSTPQFGHGSKDSNQASHQSNRYRRGTMPNNSSSWKRSSRDSSDGFSGTVVNPLDRTRSRRVIGDPEPDVHRLYVKGPEGLLDRLSELLHPYPSIFEVSQARIAQSQQNGPAVWYLFVAFGDPKEAERALQELDQQNIEGEMGFFHVRYAFKHPRIEQTGSGLGPNCRFEDISSRVLRQRFDAVAPLKPVPEISPYIQSSQPVQTNEVSSQESYEGGNTQQLMQMTKTASQLPSRPVSPPKLHIDNRQRVSPHTVSQGSPIRKVRKQTKVDQLSGAGKKKKLSHSDQGAKLDAQRPPDSNMTTEKQPLLAKHSAARNGIEDLRREQLGQYDSTEHVGEASNRSLAISANASNAQIENEVSEPKPVGKRRETSPTRVGVSEIDATKPDKASQDRRSVRITEMTSRESISDSGTKAKDISQTIEPVLTKRALARELLPSTMLKNVVTPVNTTIVHLEPSTEASQPPRNQSPKRVSSQPLISDSHLEPPPSPALEQTTNFDGAQSREANASLKQHTVAKLSLDLISNNDTNNEEQANLIGSTSGSTIPPSSQTRENPLTEAKRLSLSQGLEIQLSGYDQVPSTILSQQVPPASNMNKEREVLKSVVALTEQSEPISTHRKKQKTPTKANFPKRMLKSVSATTVAAKLKTATTSSSPSTTESAKSTSSAAVLSHDASLDREARISEPDHKTVQTDENDKKLSYPSHDVKNAVERLGHQTTFQNVAKIDVNRVRHDMSNLIPVSEALKSVVDQVKAKARAEQNIDVDQLMSGKTSRTNSSASSIHMSLPAVPVANLNEDIAQLRETTESEKKDNKTKKKKKKGKGKGKNKNKNGTNANLVDSAGPVDDFTAPTNGGVERLNQKPFNSDALVNLNLVSRFHHPSASSSFKLAVGAERADEGSQERSSSDQPPFGDPADAVDPETARAIYFDKKSNYNNEVHRYLQKRHRSLRGVSNPRSSNLPAPNRSPARKAEKIELLNPNCTPFTFTNPKHGGEHESGASIDRASQEKSGNADVGDQNKNTEKPSSPTAYKRDSSDLFLRRDPSCTSKTPSKTKIERALNQTQFDNPITTEQQIDEPIASSLGVETKAKPIPKALPFKTEGSSDEIVTQDDGQEPRYAVPTSTNTYAGSADYDVGSTRVTSTADPSTGSKSSAGEVPKQTHESQGNLIPLTADTLDTNEHWPALAKTGSDTAITEFQVERTTASYESGTTSRGLKQRLHLDTQFEPGGSTSSLTTALRNLPTTPIQELPGATIDRRNTDMLPQNVEPKPIRSVPVRPLRSRTVSNTSELSTSESVTKKSWSEIAASPIRTPVDSQRSRKSTDNFDTDAGFPIVSSSSTASVHRGSPEKGISTAESPRKGKKIIVGSSPTKDTWAVPKGEKIWGSEQGEG